MDINKKIEVFKKFTDTYQAFAHDPGRREVECMRVQYPLWLRPVQDGDMFAGRGEFDHLIGFSPQPSCNKLGYYIDDDRVNETMDNPGLSPANKAVLKKIVEFWKEEETTFRTRQSYPGEMKKALPSDNWTGEPGVAFPLYRMSGTQLDYDKLLAIGVDGLEQEIEEKLQVVPVDTPRANLYQNMVRALGLFREVCFYYADMVGSMRNHAGNSPGWQEMERILQKIAHEKPQTTREAIQLSYLYCQFSGSLNFGRVDEYLGDFLAHDLESGLLDKESAIELICNYWKMIAFRDRMFDSRLTIGGKGRRNPENADRFALYAMEAMRRVKTTTPQMTFRFSVSQPGLMDSDLMEKALDCIGAGTTFPMLYNDDVNIPAVMNAFQLPREEAEQFVPFGCGEYTIYHKSVGTPSGVINLLQALLVTLHNGTDPKTGKSMGLALGKLSDFKTFDQLYAAYQQQVEYYVEQLAYQEALEYQMAAEAGPHLYFSMLYDDCIKRGKPVFDGGVRYLGGTLESYGNTNTADSLTAIKELVYDKKKISLEQLVYMLDENFTGFEKERKMLLDCPKYGNDNALADNMKVEVDRHVCTVTRDMKDKVGLHSYLVVIINNNANTVLGRHTAASPDGRKAWTYMANGNAPSPGMDQNGLTAMLNSRVKPDEALHAGAVHNLKFSKSMFSDYRDKLKAVLKTYFEIGGAQAMITVIDKGELEKAMQEPEKYQNLVVRVGGYTAKFVDLPKDVQQEVLARTLY
jgi:pyruvate-formate lyase